ncbi:MAG: hypothetical protein GY953_19360, partial [bacterium]|nr:hypothetical protein [bacterium]
MNRRNFVGNAVAGSMLVGSAAQAQEPKQQFSEAGGGSSTDWHVDEIYIEGKQSGKPHKGKTLAAIQPHTDDIPIYAGGTVLKLIDEGYEGILINASNDEMAGRGDTFGEVILNNERDTREVARRMGLKDVSFLNYRNHLMDGIQMLEFRARLIFLFRLFKVDTILVYDPSGLYERNPDHYVTAKAVEAAAWMAGSRWDYPEHFKAGLEPYAVKDRYYFSRGPQLVNRVVDISDYMDKKAWVNVANVTQGPAGDNGSRLRRELAAQGKKLPILGDDDETANV